MDINNLNKIKRTALIALASDDELVETLVLKGGNAIDLTFRNSKGSVSRTSYDLDYSLEHGDFNEDEESISKRIENTLKQTFVEAGFIMIDYKFLRKPKNIMDELSDFWGGYKVEFKVVDSKNYQLNQGNIDKLRRSAIPLNSNSSPTFELEFSKFEYVGQKVEVSVDGYKIYVYTPEMIVFEKLRAICQQIPEYNTVIPSFTPRARARDFYDVHLIMSMHTIDPHLKENVDLIKNIFAAKKVPLDFISKIRDNKSLHLDDWKSVKDTVSADEELESFDFYFDFVLQNFENITVL